MSTRRETKSAKTGKALRDHFDPGKSFLLLEGTGRLQKRGITAVLFELDSEETISFVTCSGRSSTMRYAVGNRQFAGDGSLIGDKSAAPATPVKSEQTVKDPVKESSGEVKKKSKKKGPSPKEMGL